MWVRYESYAMNPLLSMISISMDGFLGNRS